MLFRSAATDGVVVTDHGQPVATLSQPEPVKRAQWLQERLGALKMQPIVAVDSAELISDDRNRA